MTSQLLVFQSFFSVVNYLSVAVRSLINRFISIWFYEFDQLMPFLATISIAHSELDFGCDMPMSS